MKQILHFINGEFTASENGKTFLDINPATGETIAEVAEGGPKEIDRAVAAAKAALSGPWGKMPVAERMKLLMAVADGVQKRAEAFAAAEVADTGKPIGLARQIDIPRGSANFVQFAEHFKYVATECWENEQALNYAQRRPVGVVGVISPWNFPLLLMTWKVAPALAAGNAVIVKPSEETPATASLLGEVMQEVGVPSGFRSRLGGFCLDRASRGQRHYLYGRNHDGHDHHACGSGQLEAFVF